MTTFTWPPTVIPNSSTIDFVANSARFTGESSGVPRGSSRGAEILRMTLSFSNLQSVSQEDGVQTSTNARSTLMGFLLKLNGYEHRIRLPVFGLYNQGAWSGTPLVNGSGQAGKVLAIDAAGEGNVTDYAHAGDWIEVNGELKMVMANADLSSDETTIKIWPPLRTSPADNAAIDHTTPTGVFMLEGNPLWVNRPGPGAQPFGDITVTVIEDPS